MSTVSADTSRTVGRSSVAASTFGKFTFTVWSFLRSMESAAPIGPDRRHHPSAPGYGHRP